MIISFFYILGGSVLFLLHGILSLVNFVIPQAFTNAVSYVVQYAFIFNGVFPVETLFYAIFTFLIAYSTIYGVKFTFWLISFLPFFHEKEFPTVPKNEINQYQRSSRVVNLKGRRWVNLKK